MANKPMPTKPKRAETARQWMIHASRIASDELDRRIMEYLNKHSRKVRVDHE